MNNNLGLSVPINWVTGLALVLVVIVIVLHEIGRRRKADVVDADHADGKEAGAVSRRLVLYALGAIVAVIAGGSIAVAATRYTAGRRQQGYLALTGATVLVGEGLDAEPDATVLIRDGVIVEVGANVDIPAGAETIDLSGTTLMPGLIDVHVHLGSPEMERGQRPGITQIPRIIFDALRHVPGTRRALLEHGVTSVRTLGDESAWVIELRGLIRDGELEGPRVFAAGPVFTTPGGHPIATFGVEPDSDTVRLPSTPDEARRAVRELAAGDGAVDLVKVIQERGSPERQRPLQPIAPDVLDAIVAEAHRQDLPVVAHWGTREDLDDVLAAGVDDLQHVEARGLLDGWPDGVVDTLLERDMPVTPTLAVTEVAIPSQIHRQLRQRVGELHAAGIRILAGSDAGVPGVRFGPGLQRELELLVDSGLTPREALAAATSQAARVLGTDHIGAIEPGRAADLVAVDGDPLREIGAVRKVVRVFRDGRLVVDRRDAREI